jgi:hypothetical protein
VRRLPSLIGLVLALGAWAASAADDTAANPAWPGGVDMYRLISREFIKYDPEYMAHRAAMEHRVNALQGQLIALEGGGPSLPCSRQILVEARWALTNTAAWDRVEKTAERLADSLKVPDQAFAYDQMPETGTWGACYEEWFHRIDATIDAMNTHLELGLTPDHPIKLRRVFGTPAELIEFLEGLQTSRIAETGIDNRDALGVALSALSQAAFKPQLNAFMLAHSTELPIGDGYAAEFRKFLDRTQDSQTGYWGAWYESDGARHVSADLSLTFHTVNHRRGNVERWPQIIDTTFAIRDLPYPYGWLHRGGFNNHNNYDVAVILRYGWPHMTEAQRERARRELDGMLAFALGPSMAPAGGFLDDPSFYSTPADAFYYGIAFLDAVGFWDRAKRFWTDREFDDAIPVACRIRAELK